MGCRDGFVHTGIIVKIAFFIVFVSMFCNWLAFTTNSWRRTPENGMTKYSGLWRVCYEMEGTCSQLDGIGFVRVGVTQAFAIIGFMSQNLGFVLIMIYMFKNHYMGNVEIAIGAACLLILSAIGWLIAVAVYGGHYTGDAEYLHYSYGLAVVACGLGLLGGILMLLGRRGHNSVVVVVTK